MQATTAIREQSRPTLAAIDGTNPALIVSGMSAEQTWLESRTSGTRIPLEDSGVIGRGPTAALRVDDAGVSREHAAVRRRDGAWWVQDLGSANGTFVNGLPANVSMKLRDGDEVCFGPARYVFRGPDAFGTSSTHTDIGEVTIVGRTPGELNVTLLVADVMGFSELSTRFSAAEMSSAMTAWCGHCRTIMHQCGGHVDKFIGDCVFAWWHGFTAAVKTQALTAARAISAGLPEARLPDGSTLRCGVGLHSGEAVLSMLGPSSHTLLGSDVNFAFRIETLTRKLEPVVVSRPFANGWPDDSAWAFPTLGTHEIKGWPHPVEVCGVRPPGAT